MTSARNVASPVSGSDDGTLRRLGEQVRSIFASDEFLSRLKVGPVIHAASGTTSALAWGEENRAQLTGNAKFRLPPMDAKWIGKPLAFVKQSATGIATLLPSGSSSAMVDGSPTGVAVQAAGLYNLITDGQNWFSDSPRPNADSANVGKGTDANQELFWNGSIWVPRYPRTAQYHDTTFSPIGLWQLNRSLADTSGNGNALTTSTGSARYVEIVPGLTGGFFDAWRLVENSGAAALRLLGDVTIEMLMVMRIYRPDVVAIYSHMNTGETAPDNTLYQTTVSTTFTLDWLQENGLGVDANSSCFEQAPDVLPCHFATTRASGIIRNFVNGTPIGIASGILAAPTDGSAGKLYVGGALGINSFSGMLASFKIIGSALTPGQLTEEYNRTLAPVLGYK